MMQMRLSEKIHLITPFMRIKWIFQVKLFGVFRTDVVTNNEINLKWEMKSYV